MSPKMGFFQGCWTKMTPISIIATLDSYYSTQYVRVAHMQHQEVATTPLGASTPTMGHIGTHTHTRTPSHSSTPTHTKKCARTVTQTHTHTPLHLIACARHRDKDCHPSPCRGNAGGLRNGSQKPKREYGANFWQAVACIESTEEQMHSVTNNLPLSHPNYQHHQRRFLVIM